MAKRSRSPRLEKHREYRERSGWWLAAWRDYAKLSLEELAEEMETSKGQVSDLETGSGQARYNRNWMEKAASALKIPQGYLMDVNPFEADPVLESMLAAYRRLDSSGKNTAADMVRVLAERQKA